MAAAAYQKAASAIPDRAGVASTSHPATRWAPDQSGQAARGDQRAGGRRPDVRVGSNTQHGPHRDRQDMVVEAKSSLTDVAITGPRHSSSAGTANPLVLPD